MTESLRMSEFATSKRIVSDEGRLVQVAALVYRLRQSELEYLLITSRTTGRWIIPKGWPMPGKTFSQAAMIEAMEEAGIRGVIDGNNVGRFHYVKPDMPRDDNSGGFDVYVYPLLFSHQVKEWPERGQRRFEWVAAQEASRRISETGLKEIMATFYNRFATGRLAL